MKQVWMYKCPTRSDVFDSNNDSYWKRLEKSFLEDCKRHRIDDPEIVEIRKSAPLYRDLSGTRVTAVRAMYANEKVDCKTIAKSMILEGNKYSLQKLAEFNLTYQCIGRGGEHLYLRFPECCYDSFFQVPDFEWTMIKQKSTKCALLFMDRKDYCLCPIWGLGAFFMFDGLLRGEFTGATRDYVFPGLHNLRKDKVANALTESIKRHIKKIFPNDVAKLHSVRSLRKGTMTMNRCNRSLSTQEEYARSGHTAPDANSHAEGYIETTAAMSAPAGRALAGYSARQATFVIRPKNVVRM